MGEELLVGGFVGADGEDDSGSASEDDFHRDEAGLARLGIDACGIHEVDGRVADADKFARG